MKEARDSHIGPYQQNTKGLGGGTTRFYNALFKAAFKEYLSPESDSSFHILGNTHTTFNLWPTFTLSQA